MVSGSPSLERSTTRGLGWPSWGASGSRQEVASGLGERTTGVGVRRRRVNPPWRDAIAAAETALGPIDILVNNAGLTRDNLLLRLTTADWETVLSANLTGAFHTTRAVIKGMMKRRWGRIVNITSIVGITGNKGQANYAASKAGLIGFTKSVAKEYASRGILANCVAPGFIETDMTSGLPDEARASLLEDIALGRMGRPEDVAGAVLFLASDLAGYITGQVLVVDGGMVI